MPRVCCVTLYGPMLAFIIGGEGVRSKWNGEPPYREIDFGFVFVRAVRAGEAKLRGRARGKCPAVAPFEVTTKQAKFKRSRKEENQNKYERISGDLWETLGSFLGPGWVAPQLGAWWFRLPRDRGAICLPVR